jgi:hypothetical protein
MPVKVRTAKEVGQVTGRRQGWASFPNPVNDVAARVVAAGVVAMCLATFALGRWWVLIPLVYGFWARVFSGPRLSPLGQLATRVLAPRLGAARLVPGPPKRFAQAMGVVFSTTARVVWSGFSDRLAAGIVLGLLTTAASLEAGFGLCLGCKAFGLLMRAGVIPADVCEQCSDLRLRHPELARPAH